MFLAELVQDVFLADPSPVFGAGTSRLDVGGGDDVGVAGEPAAFALEVCLVGPVVWARVSASWAFLAGVCGVDAGDGDALRFVQALELVSDGGAACAGDETVELSA